MKNVICNHLHQFPLFLLHCENATVITTIIHFPFPTSLKMTLKPQLLLLLLLLLHAAAPAHATGEGEAKASVAVGGGAETGQAAAEPAGVPLDAPPALSGELLRIGVASCYNERRDSKALWQRLAAREPRMLLLLGDNVYADHPLFFKIRVPATVADIRRSYQRLGSHPDFARLRQQVPVYATWDDHGKKEGKVVVVPRPNVLVVPGPNVLEYLD